MTRFLNQLIIAMGIMFSTSTAFGAEGDRDDDTVLDAADKCPDAKGDAAHSGCPDSDSDGVFDDADVCKDEADESDDNTDGCPACKPEDGLSRCMKKETVDIAAAQVRAHVGKYHAVDSAQWTAIALLRAGAWDCDAIGALQIPDQKRYYSVIWADVRQAKEACLAYSAITLMQERMQVIEADIFTLKEHDVVAHPELLDYLSTDEEVDAKIAAATARPESELRFEVGAFGQLTQAAPNFEFHTGIGLSYSTHTLLVGGNILLGVEPQDSQFVGGARLFVGGNARNTNALVVSPGFDIGFTATAQREQHLGQVAIRSGGFVRVGNHWVSGEAGVGVDVAIRDNSALIGAQGRLGVVFHPKIVGF